MGIPEEKQKLIFDAFAQADSATTRRFGGSGLGLAIARSIMVSHGGTLAVVPATVPDAGAAFRAHFPPTPEPAAVPSSDGPGLAS